MTQLIIDGVVLPESRNGGYTVEKVPLFVDVEMITGRTVRELRGDVWTISYQYGYFDDEMKNKVIAACEKGRINPITCGFLIQESKGPLTYSEFFVTFFQRPKFMWSRRKTLDGVPIPMWGDFAIELREVEPSD